MLKWITVFMFIFILSKTYYQGKFSRGEIIWLKGKRLHNFVRYSKITTEIIVLVYILPGLYECLFPVGRPMKYAVIHFNVINYIGDNLYLTVVLIWISLFWLVEILLNIFCMQWAIFISFWWITIVSFPHFSIMFLVLCPSIFKGVV